MVLTWLAAVKLIEPGAQKNIQVANFFVSAGHMAVENRDFP